MADIVKAPVKSAWASKINWTQAIALAATVGTFFGIDLDAETQAAILAGIASASTVATWVQRTWFTRALTPGSVGQ